MFAIKSGKVVVSDPCYERGTWCQAVLENVKNGNWISNYKLNSEGSVSEIVAFIGFEPHQWEKISAEIGVDSGQAGIFDEFSYRNDSLIKENPKWYFDKNEIGDKFYGKCCDITLDEQAGELEMGFVSSSGYGDGGYDCFISKNSTGEIIGIKVVFISEEDE